MRKQFCTASIVSGLTLSAGALLLKKAQGTAVRWMQDAETYLDPKEPALLRSCIGIQKFMIRNVEGGGY